MENSASGENLIHYVEVAENAARHITGSYFILRREDIGIVKETTYRRRGIKLLRIEDNAVGV